MYIMYFVFILKMLNFICCGGQGLSGVNSAVEIEQFCLYPHSLWKVE